MDFVSPENRFLEEGKSSELTACLQIIQETTVDDGTKYSTKTCRELARIIVCRTYASAIHELCHLVTGAVFGGSDNHRFEALFFTSGAARASSFRAHFSAYKDTHPAVEISNKNITIDYTDKPFSVTYSRMPLLSALMEFLMTSIGYSELDGAFAPLLANDFPSQKQVSNVANDVSKQIYTYLGEHLPPVQEQRKSQSFLRFVTTRASEDLSAACIDDDALIEYWTTHSNQSTDEQSVDVKTYRSVFRIAAHLVRVLRYADEQFRMSGAAPIGTNFETGEVDPSDLEAALAEIEDDQHPLDDLAGVVKAGVKIANKREMEILSEALHGDDVASALPKSILRNAVFGDAQAGLTQVLRQKKTSNLDAHINQIPEDDYQSRFTDYIKVEKHLEQMLLASFYILSQAGNPTSALVALALRPDLDISNLAAQPDEPDWGDSNVVSFRAENALARFFDRIADDPSSELGQLAADARAAYKGISRQGFGHSEINQEDIIDHFVIGANLLITLRKDLFRFLNQHTSSIDWSHQITIDTPLFQSQFKNLYGGTNG